MYITSYLNKVDGPVSLDDTSIVFVIQTISQALFMPMALFLMKYLPPWACCIIGGILTIGGVFVSSFIKSYILFCIVYPTLFGMGIGFSYMAPVVSGWEYFPNRRGLVSGLIVLGFGFGSFIFGFISLAVANPENVDPELSVSGGKIFEASSPIAGRAPKMLRINCAIWLGMLLVALPLIRRKQQSNSVEEDQDDATSVEKNERLLSTPLSSDQTEIVKNVDPTFLQSMKDYRTLQIWIMMICSCSFPLYIASNFKSYEQKDLNDDQFITIVGSVGAVFNGVSRGFWSSLMDLVGFKIVYITLLILEIAIAFTFALVHKVKALFFVWVCCSFTCLGGHFSIFPTLSAKIYGPAAGGKVYTVLFTAFAMGTIINFILTKQSGKGSIDYEVLFYILASMAILSLISAIFLNVNKKVIKKVERTFGYDSSDYKIGTSS